MAALTVTSQPLVNGQSVDEWFAYYLANAPLHPECFPPRTGWEPMTIDGHQGGIHGGLPVCNFTEAVVDARRTYVVSVYTDRHAPSGQVFDRPTLDAILASLKLDPASAHDQP